MMPFKIKKNNRTLLITSALLLIGAGLLYAYTAYGVTRTWDGGGGDANWNTAANWSGDVAPGVSDIASFDGTCVSNCSPTVNVAVSVAGINMASGYTGTITQSTTNTITVGSSHWVQAAGTFTGGSGAITVNGTFTLSGGTFTSTIGTLQVGRNMYSETFFTVSGGTFAHNNGTVKFAQYYSGSAGDAKTVDVVTSLTLYNIIIDTNTLVNCITTAAGDTIIAANDFTITGGTIMGTWEVQGNIIIGAGADSLPYPVTTVGTLTYTGTGSKTYTYTTGGVGPHLRVNTASGSLAADAGTTDLSVDNFSLLAGTFTAPTGTMTVGRNMYTETFFTVSSGTFNHNNGTVKFDQYYNGQQGDNKTVDVATSLTLYNIIIDPGTADAIITASGDTIIAANDFTISTGTVRGSWEFQGNITMSAGASQPTSYSATPGTLTYTGTGSKVYTYASGGTGPHLRVNTATGSLSANTGTTELKVSLFSLLAGTFTAPTGTMTVGRMKFTETFFTVSGGTFTHSNGTVKFVQYYNSQCADVKTVDVATSLTLYNIIIDTGSYAECITAASGDTIIAANDLTITGGGIVGAWEVQGNIIIGAGADGGSATLAFTGSNAQTYTDQGGNEPDGDVTINKTSGTVTLASNADWNAASQDLIITSGTLSSATYNVATVNFTVNGGTFTGGSGTVTTSGPLVVSSGTFTGGAGNITINYTFTLSGGTFTNTSGTLTVGGITSTATVFTVASGSTFNHNNGTVTFVGDISSHNIYTVNVATTLTLYNIIVNMPNNADSLTTAAGDTVIAANDFTYTAAAAGLNGTWEVQGNVVIGSGALGGSGTLTMTGSGAHTYAYTSGSGPKLVINNSAAVVSAAGGTTNLGVSAFSLLNGTFTAPTGTMTAGAPTGGITGAATVFNVASGTTFNHNNGTVTFAGDNGSHNGYTVDVPTTLTLYNIIVNMPSNTDSLTTAAGDTVVAANNFTYTAAYAGLNGTWAVQGNVLIATTAYGGTATLTYTGPNDQTYTDQGGNEPDGDVTINKTSGTVTLASNADWNATSQDVIITSGILSMGATYSIATTALTVSAGGALLNPGTGDLTLGGTVANAGRILMQRGSCANTDSVLIRSSVAGTQRSWNGAGTFTLTDVDVKDMAGSASITAYSSTNTGNNGANWTFNSGCVALPPVASFPTSKFTFPGGKVNFR